MSDQVVVQINSLNDKAFTAYQQGHYKQGIHFAQQACDLAKAYFGMDHLKYATTLNNLAFMYEARGCFLEAKFLRWQASKIVGSELATDHPDYGTSLNKIALLSEGMGCFLEAESLHLQAIEIRIANLDTNPTDYAQSLNNLASLYRVMGRFSNAERLFIQAAEKLVKAKLSTDELILRHATVLNNLATLYEDISRFIEAEYLYLLVKKIREEKLGTDHLDYATVLNNLASLYQSMGRFSDAEPLLLQAKDIWKDKRGTNHSDYARSLNNLALLYIAIDKFSEAKLLLQEARKIWGGQLGTDHPDYAIALNNLALLYKDIGLFSKAKPLYRKTLKIFGAKLATDHPDYAVTLNNLALLQVATDRPLEALRRMQEAVEIENRMLSQIFSISSDNQRLTYLQQKRGEFYGFLSLVTQYLPDAPDAIQAAFDLVLRSKALGAEAAAMQRTAILSDRYRHLAPQLEQLRQLDNQIASLAWNVPPPEQLTAYQTQLATLYQQRDELDRALSRDIPEMNLQKQLDTANRDAIAKALPDGATLVEFVRFDVFNFKAIRAKGDSQWLPARYLAFILPAKEPEQVQMIDLGEAEAIDNLIRVFRKSVSKGDRDLDLDDLDSTPEDSEPIPPDEQLRQKLIDPLKPYLKPQQQVFLAPDGELTCLPFGVLPTAEGRYLMEDYELCYLSVGRDLLRFGATQTLVQPTGPLVIADPDYNLSHSDLTPQLLTKAPASLQGKGEQEELPSPCRLCITHIFLNTQAIANQVIHS